MCSSDIYILISLVPIPTVRVTALNTQTVGQSLTLQCEVTTVRGITSGVDIVWRSGGTMLRSTNDTTADTIGNSLVYTDSYNISTLNTSDNNRVIECEIMIDVDPIVTANGNIMLDVIGEYLLYYYCIHMYPCSHVVPISPIIITPPGPIQGSVVGSPLSLNCIVSTVIGVDSDIVMIGWMGPGGVITNDSRVTISPTTSSGNNYTSILQFTYLIEDDEREYICNVTILETSVVESVRLEDFVG